MFDKNPYETEEENLEEREDDGVDMSAFNLADNNSNDDEFEYDEEETERKLNYRSIVVIGAVLIVILLIAAIAGWIFGISKSNSLNKLKTEYTTVETKLTEANKNLEALQNDYNVLQAEFQKAEADKQNEETTSSEGSGEAVKADTYYVMKGDVAVRKGAGTSNDFANFDKLPAEIQDVVYSNEGEVRTRDDAKVPVYETKKDSASNVWGRIADNAWVCLTYQGEAWGTQK